MKEHETNSLKKTKVLVLIPIVIGAAAYGAATGAWLGLVFGIVVLVGCITGSDVGGNMMWNFSPLMTALICLIKGTAAGYLSGLVFRALEKKNQIAATVTAAVVCPVVNTGLFCLGAVLAFRPLLEQWAGGASLVSYIFLGLVGLNFLIELLINVVLSPIVVRILKIRKIV